MSEKPSHSKLHTVICVLDAAPGLLLWTMPLWLEKTGLSKAAWAAGPYSMILLGSAVVLSGAALFLNTHPKWKGLTAVVNLSYLAYFLLGSQGVI